jgi:hypothetical protein
MSLETQYKTVQDCKKPMPIIPTGEDAKEVLAQAREVYNNPKYKGEAGYPEFAQLYEQKLKEGHEYCGGKVVVQESETSGSKAQIEKTIKRWQIALKYASTNEETAKIEKIIKRWQIALKY